MLAKQDWQITVLTGRTTGAPRSEIVNGVRVTKEDKWGKNRLLVVVELDDITADDGEPVRLRRSFAISYGKNTTTGQSSALVQMIAVAMQMNQASCLLRALFHMPMHFQTPSQMARRMIMGSSTASQAGN